MNIVTIDPSLTSTGVCINGAPMVFVGEHVALSKTKMKQWFERSDDHCKINLISKVPDDESFSLSEVSKLNFFNSVANKIIDTIDKAVISTDNTLIVIEGYSYSSAAGPLIDLVTFGTLLRYKIFERFPKWELIVLAPTTVKKLVAKLTYDPIKKGKQTVYRNKQGVAGGSFKKHDIYKALTENNSIQCDWVNFLREFQDEVMELKSVPKPIEDINDSVSMYYAIKKEFESCNQELDATISSLSVV